ncbi:MAG TPA: YbaK/EbsC family protein [Actinomycetota bacterium]
MDEPIDTRATRAAAEAGIAFAPVRTERPTSAEESARLQGIALHQLLRTIVVRRGTEDYLFVLVPGGRQIDWPKLRAHLGVSRLSLPDQDEARAATGYERGTITPFGAEGGWPVIADATIEGRVAIGGGAHGVNLHVDATDLVRALRATVVDVTAPAQERP